MLASLDKWVCPNCQNRFPFWIRPSLCVFKGFFSTPNHLCPKCNTVCRKKISWPNALWAWPLGGVLSALVFLVFREHSFFVLLRRHEPAIYGALAGGFAPLPIVFAMRASVFLVPATKTPSAKPQIEGVPTLKEILKVALPVGLTMTWVFIAIATGHWQELLIAVVIGLLVWTIFYSFSKTSKKNV